MSTEGYYDNMPFNRGQDTFFPGLVCGVINLQCLRIIFRSGRGGSEISSHTLKRQSKSYRMFVLLCVGRN